MTTTTLPRQLAVRLLLASLGAGLAACASEPIKEPDLERLYERAARFHDAPRNPVVVIPGVLGSRLVDDATGTLVWGAFTGDYADPKDAEGAELMALPLGMGAPLHELFDGVRPDGALESIDVSLFGLPYTLEAYHGLLRTLGAAGYRDSSLVTGAPASAWETDGVLDWGDEHFTCFQFDYDWRRSIPENAAALGAFLDARAKEVKADRARRFGPEAGREAVHFDLVAHSLGGLVARWYLMYGADPGREVNADTTPEEILATLPKVSWAGAPKVDRAILVAPPNLGAASALSDMVFGMDLGAFAATYPPHVLGTLPVTYQLLPSAPGAFVDAATGRTSASEDGPDLYDPELWRHLGWGLAGATDEQLAQIMPHVDTTLRRELAFEHQAKCLNEARRVQAALRQKTSRPDGLDLVLFAGDAKPTASAQQFLVEGGKLWTRDTAPGDGVVTRASALGDLRPQPESPDWSPRVNSPIDWSQVTFVFEDHLDMTDAPSFVDNLLYQLLEAQK